MDPPPSNSEYKVTLNPKPLRHDMDYIRVLLRCRLTLCRVEALAFRVGLRSQS